MTRKHGNMPKWGNDGGRGRRRRGIRGRGPPRSATVTPHRRPPPEKDLCGKYLEDIQKPNELGGDEQPSHEK